MKRVVLMPTFALALVAAGTGAAFASGSVRPTTLRVAMNAKLDSVDPAVANAPNSLLLENAICAKLYAFAGSATSVTPEIAAGMPVVGPSADRPREWKTYTIKLKKTYKFEDGTPVTAYSFADALDRDADPDLQSPAVGDMMDIVGLGSVLASDSRTLPGVVAVNNTTLEISTVKADPSLASTLALSYFCPVEEDTPVAAGGVEHPPSAGPYYVQANTPTRVILKKNPFYTGPRPARFDFIAFTSGVTLADCKQQVVANTRDVCLDGLPLASSPVSTARLVAADVVARSVGCLSWAAPVGLDLATTCRR